MKPITKRSILILSMTFGMLLLNGMVIFPLLTGIPNQPATNKTVQTDVELGVSQDDSTILQFSDIIDLNSGLGTGSAIFQFVINGSDQFVTLMNGDMLIYHITDLASQSLNYTIGYQLQNGTTFLASDVMVDLTDLTSNEHALITTNMSLMAEKLAEEQLTFAELFPNGTFVYQITSDAVIIEENHTNGGITHSQTNSYDVTTGWLSAVTLSVFNGSHYTFQYQLQVYQMVPTGTQVGPSNTSTSGLAPFFTIPITTTVTEETITYTSDGMAVTETDFPHTLSEPVIIAPYQSVNTNVSGMIITTTQVEWWPAEDNVPSHIITYDVMYRTFSRAFGSRDTGPWVTIVSGTTQTTATLNIATLSHGEIEIKVIADDGHGLKAESTTDVLINRDFPRGANFPGLLVIGISLITFVCFKKWKYQRK